MPTISSTHVVEKRAFNPLIEGTLSLSHGIDGTPTTTRQTVLQQHCAFWDRDEDGVIWPLDTFRGFRELGFNLLISTLAIFIIHSGFSYPTVLYTSWIPDPLFRVYLNGIHKGKHGSDSGTYDTRGYFQPSQYNKIFERYAKTNPGGLTVYETMTLIAGQRNAVDPFGWFAAIFEWYTTVLLTYDRKTGLCGKDDIQRIFDGSYFWYLKRMRDAGRQDELPGMSLLDGIECWRRGLNSPVKSTHG